MAQRHKGAPTEALALHVLVKLMRAANTVSMRLAHSPAMDSLTQGQFAVLEALYHLGPLPQKRIARKLLSSGSNVCMVLDNLERDGLVRRVREREDRRQVTVHLTPEGQARIAGVFPAHAATVAKLFAVLDESEQVQLGALCKKLGLALAQTAEAEE